MQNHKKTTQEIKTSVFLRGRKIQRFFQHHNIYNPAWNLDKTSLAYIKNQIKENKLNNILEIGTYNALTAIEFATINNNIKITTIEINKEFIKIAKQNIAESKQKNKPTKTAINPTKKNKTKSKNTNNKNKKYFKE